MQTESDTIEALDFKYTPPCECACQVYNRKSDTYTQVRECKNPAEWKLVMARLCCGVNRGRVKLVCDDCLQEKMKNKSGISCSDCKFLSLNFFFVYSSVTRLGS